MRRLWLIAKREFDSFADGPTFWVALFFGPVAAVIGGVAGARPFSGVASAMAARSVIPPVMMVHLVVALFLWLTLVTTLGMLLQAIVRERTSRSLETLLASVRPHEILIGKMVGVGAVSGMVMASALASILIMALESFGRDATILPPAMLQAAADPSLMLQAVVLFVAAFAFYGAVIAVAGVLARDEAGAQNLARPLFGVLLLIFFGALTATSMKVSPPDWLVWLPPLAPFMLLLKPGLLSAPGWIVVLAETGAAAAVLLWIGGRLLSGQGFRSAAARTPGFPSIHK